MAKVTLFFKGIFMGIADVIPGVSGGTVAFILGIYEELITSISKINIESLKILRKEGILKFWKYINGSFLVTLLTGILSSILIFSRIITTLLDRYPILILAFFFGLILSSIFFLLNKVSKWNYINVSALVVFSVLAYLITIIEPKIAPDSYIYIFISGFIAIIAMILPGISGAFILLLMGSYQIIIGMVSNLHKDFLGSVDFLSVFALGCILGLLSFSKVLTYLFKNYHNITISILIGFMIGSLNKIWPWKEIISYRINSKGESVPLLEKSILPDISDKGSFFLMAIIFFIIGFFVVFFMEKLNKEKVK